jgi:hypothetical protein
MVVWKRPETVTTGRPVSADQNFFARNVGMIYRLKCGDDFLVYIGGAPGREDKIRVKGISRRCLGGGSYAAADDSPRID